MQYMGGKVRVRKHLIPFIEAAWDGEQDVYEPFCGGAAMTEVLPGKVYASDIDAELIAFWKAIQDGWEPPAGAWSSSPRA